MRIAMIHQPHFIPWPGYFARCLSVDEFIILDDVLFKRSHFQQRTMYFTRSGTPKWLTLPIEKAKSKQRIADTRIAPTLKLKVWRRGFCHSYRDTPYFDKVWPEVERAIEEHRPSLLNVNLALIHLVISLLYKQAPDLIHYPSVSMSSSFNHENDRTKRLISICHSLEVSHLILGHDAQRVHNLEALAAANVKLVEHIYTGPEEERPTPGVSLLDWLLKRGDAWTAERLSKNWKLQDISSS